MSHLDDELIAAAAIGERLADGDSAHLVECAECAGHLRLFAVECGVSAARRVLR